MFIWVKLLTWTYVINTLSINCVISAIIVSISWAICYFYYRGWNVKRNTNVNRIEKPFSLKKMRKKCQKRQKDFPVNCIWLAVNLFMTDIWFANAFKWLELVHVNDTFLGAVVENFSRNWNWFGKLKYTYCLQVNW